MPELVVVAADILGVGRVKHEQHVGRQAAVQPLHFVEGNVGAGRIVGIGEEYDLGLLRHRRKDCVDARGIVGFGRDDRLRAGSQSCDRIDEEAMRSVDRLIAIGEIGACQQVQQIVGAGAADDAAWIEPECASDRFAQHGRGAVRIVFQTRAHGLVRGDRARTGPERRLVGRQLEYLGDAAGAALAGHVGLDFEHAGPGLGIHAHLWFLPSSIRKRGGNQPFAGTV